MRAEDVDRVAGLATQLGYPAGPADVAPRFAELTAHPAEHAVLVATDDADRVVGWIHVAQVRSIVTSDVAMIGGLVVGDGARSAGIGAGLVAAAEAWARDHGARTMTVRSRTERARAHRFYERQGYVPVKLSHVFEKPIV
jgi:GNAT superfamily N-acetyltransferase